MEFLEQLLNVELGLPARFIIAFIFVLLLIALTAWVIRRIAAGRGGIGGVRARQQRLAVVDAAHIDAKRRLVLIRCDNTEHLILIGGPSDVVVESRIGHVEPQRAASPPAQQPRSAPPPSRAGEQPAPTEPRRDAPTPATRPAPAPTARQAAVMQPSGARQADVSSAGSRGASAPPVEPVVRAPIGPIAAPTAQQSAPSRAEPRFPMPGSRGPDRTSPQVASASAVEAGPGPAQGDPQLEAMAQRLESALKRPPAPNPPAPDVHAREQPAPRIAPEDDLAKAMAAEFNLDIDERNERREENPHETSGPRVNLYDDEDTPRER